MKKFIVLVYAVMQTIMLMGQITNAPYNSRVNSVNLHRFSLLSVEIRPDCTILTTKVTPLEDNTYIYADKNDYIEDAETGQKYYIVGSDIGFTPNCFIMEQATPRIYTEVYPALPSNVKTINIYESDKGYYIRNLKLNRSNDNSGFIGSSELAIKGVKVGGPVLEFVKQMESKGYSIAFPGIEKSMQDDLAIEMYGGEIFDKGTHLYIWYTKTSNLVYKVDIQFGGLNTWDMISSTYYFAKQQLTIKYGYPFAVDEFRNFAVTSSYSDIRTSFLNGSSYSRCGYLVPSKGTIILHLDVEGNDPYFIRLNMTYINLDNEKLNKTEMLIQYQNEI